MCVLAAGLMADAAAKIAALETTVAGLQATVTTLVHAISNATADLNTTAADTAEEFRELKGSVDTFYLLYSGTLVFFMQACARTPAAVGRTAAAPWSHLPTVAPCCFGRLGLACSKRGRSASRTRATSC